MAKNGLGIMVSLDLSLSVKHGGEDRTNDKLRAFKLKRSPW
jgi:hypothetical protein